MPVFFYRILQHKISLAYIITNILISTPLQQHNNEKLNDRYEQSVVSLFYEEIQSMCRNCYTFNTEVQGLVGHAHKISLSLWRHVREWILHPNRPESASLCSDTRCLYSGKEIERLAAMKCGHCGGTYDLDSLQAGYDGGDIYVVPVTQELVDAPQIHEWCCPLCMKEDSLRTPPPRSNGSAPCYIDEFGASLLYPWTLNPDLSTKALKQAQDRPSLAASFDALRVLADPNKTNLYQKGHNVYASADGAQLWTPRERLCVLQALVNCASASPAQMKRLEGQVKEA